jgi:hypothetical protein
MLKCLVTGYCDDALLLDALLLAQVLADPTALVAAQLQY